MLYLQFIQDSVPEAFIAVLAIGFAAASMSCADTFATSAASCISRDIVQRHIRPEATMKEMLAINRGLVVVVIAISAAIALKTESIVEAVIIATVIGTTSYFFPIIGGLFWRRATKWGALAAVIIGGGTQIALVSYEKFWLKAPLDTLSPYLTEHGVLVGLSLSALFFVGISLVTPKPEPTRLAPFFSDVGRDVFGTGILRADRNDARYRDVAAMIEEKLAGDRAHLHLCLNVVQIMTEGGRIEEKLEWDRFVKALIKDHSSWFALTGNDTVYRLSQSDMLASVKMVRGDLLQIWLSAEPRRDLIERQRDEIYVSCEEIESTLVGLGLTSILDR